MKSTKGKLIILLIIFIIILCLFAVIKISKEVRIAMLKNMDDKKFVEYVYKLLYDNNIESYIFKIRYGKYDVMKEYVSSVEEALNEARDYGISEKCELIQNKIVKETDLYYVVYHEYISHRGHGIGDITFKEKLLFFKSYDVENEEDCINVKKLNSKRKIKEYFDMLEFLNPTGVNKNMNATISENKNEYIYSFYYIGIGHGDYGLHDMIYFGKKTISINKFTGKYTTKYETIRTAEGKYNENPNVLRY